AHGFTQPGRLWGPFAGLVGRRRHLASVDLPGHGASAGVRATLDEGGDLLAAAAAAVAAVAGSGEPGDLLGYSLGARFALHAALRHPDVVRRLVLIGGTAGIDDPAARAARRARDEATADDLERTGDVGGFLRRWVGGPMWASLPEAAAGLGERRRNTAAGLASSLRLAGTGTQEPLWDALGSLAPPVLVIAGAVDVRFTVAGQRLARAVPAGVLSLVPGAGHAAHLERPDLAAAVVERFLD
ncbi:MAG: alpha/beta fold hydrolase, partial [Acidimicrobiales bacterium]